MMTTTAMTCCYHHHHHQFHSNVLLSLFWFQFLAIFNAHETHSSECRCQMVILWQVRHDMLLKHWNSDPEWPYDYIWTTNITIPPPPLPPPPPSSPSPPPPPPQPSLLLLLSLCHCFCDHHCTWLTKWLTHLLVAEPDNSTLLMSKPPMEQNPEPSSQHEIFFPNAHLTVLLPHPPWFQTANLKRLLCQNSIRIFLPHPTYICNQSCSHHFHPRDASQMTTDPEIWQATLWNNAILIAFLQHCHLSVCYCPNLLEHTGCSSVSRKEVNCHPNCW